MKCIWLVATAIPVLLLGIASLTALPQKLVYNPSKSAPVGFYWVDQKPVRQGDFAFVRVPAEVRDLVEERGYLPPDVPLLKRVMALEGDEICSLGPVIAINERVVATALEQDRLGREMPIWQGCQVLGWADVFLLQDHQQSFDGRYFGPIDRRLIIGRARLLQFPWRKQRDR